MLGELPVTRVLLLQGPNGPFFRRLADYFLDRGVEVTKVNFNPGDSLFFRGPEVIHYRDPLESWGPRFRALVRERGIDGVFLFGDCRPMHRESIAIARELGVPVWVFEEGYLRPDYVTIEAGGVNGNSPMPKDPQVYRDARDALDDLPDPEPVGNAFYHHAWWATLHSLAITLGRWRYPHYEHHRDVHSLRQGAYWLRGSLRKLWFSIKERDVLEEITGDWSGRYFFVPLQVHCDAQLNHARFGDMEEFMDTVVREFAAHAPFDMRLVIKHHPHDRAYRDYTSYIAQLARRHDCAGRLVYVHDVHLPTLLKNARGVITMNSTVGTSALHHGAPVIVLGEAVYDIPGLTFQGTLAEFLVSPGEVDRSLFDGFCAWLRATSQINGSFYRVLDRSNPTGLRLPPPLARSAARDRDQPAPPRRETAS